jgi:asparagine synthase (glutamine-hydrolysing)
MCGIAGQAALDPRRPLRTAPVLGMLRRLAHRGPDDEGIHEAPGVVLGHRRLSVIDLEGGHQPLFGEDRRTAVVCNGEIYNYRELRRELESNGSRFRTSSDTEVAAFAYDAWGLQFLDRLDGMYAIALWDGAHRRLVLARDRLGEKPLYWTVADGQLVFGSELSALLAHPDVDATIDPEALSEYLALEYVPAPRTIIRNVSKLEPGHVLVLENGRIDVRAYWTLDPRPRGGVPPYPEAVRELRRLLEESIRSRLVSDVPLGIFLSGGLDSSAIAAFAAMAGPVETFSIGFEESTFDESGWARDVANSIGSRHHERIVRGSEMPDLVPDLAHMLDEPLGDSSILPTAVVSKFARERVTVALGGDGGDELFAGYPMHRAHRIAPWARAVPSPIHRVLDSIAGRMPVSHQNFSAGFKLRSFLRGSTASPPDSHALWMSSFSPAEQRTLLTPAAWEASNPKRAFEAFHRAWSASKGAPRLARATHLDALTYLPNDILMKVDRASMAFALELRAPFLARDVVEFAFSLPDSYRMRGLTGKRILRDAVRDVVPQTVLDRPKKGFGMPVAAWLMGPLRPLAEAMLSPDRLRSAGWFRGDAVTRLLREHQEGRADHRKPLWTLFVFEMWREHHIAARTTIREIEEPARVTA